jgi:hypothetical protein
MFTLVIAQKLGVESDLTLGFSIFEGVCLTVALMLLVERYLFSTTSTLSLRRMSGRVGKPPVLAVAADRGAAGGSTTPA